MSGVTCAFTPGINVVNGGSYKVMVKAVNPVGLPATAITDGVTVDFTAPVIGRVSIGATASTGEDTMYQLSRSTVKFAWAGITELETPLTSVTAALGSRPGLDDVKAWAAVSGVDANTSARNSTASTFSGMSLTDGVSVYVTVATVNGVGLVSRRSSRGLLVDGSPPDFTELPALPFVPSYALPRQFDKQDSYPDAVDGVTVTVPLLSFADPHSGITEAVVTLYVNESDPSPTAEVGSGELLPGVYDKGMVIAGPFAANITHGLYQALAPPATVTNGSFVWAVVEVTNPLGLSTTRTSRAVHINTEGLSAGFVNDGALGAESPDLDLAYQPSNASYSARWSGFTDPRSKIFYSVCLGTAPGECDVRAWQDVREKQGVDVLQELSVPAGTVIFATVEARTDLGSTATASSNGIVAGANPPTVANVVFASTSPLATTAIDVNSSAHYVAADALALRWEASDEQGMESCVVDVRGSPQTDDVLLTATVAGDERSVVFTEALAEGQPLYASVTCTNIRGLSTTALAAHWGIVETTPPDAGTVVNSDTSSGIRYTATGDAASAHWFGFADPESHIVAFHACLGTGQDACHAYSADVGSASTAMAAGLALRHGEDYQWTVTATSGAGVTTSTRSPVFTPDLHPPATTDAVVVDGLPMTVDDADSSTRGVDTDSYDVSWGGFTDDVSGISHYTVRLGFTPGGDDVAAAVRVKAATHHHTFGNMAAALGSGGHVYATVEAVDNVGHTAEAVSEGLVVDSSPPVPPFGEAAINETFAGNADVDLQASTVLALVWQPFSDPHTGIDRYEVRVDDVTGASIEVLGWASVGAATNFTHSALPLAHGRTYMSTVRAYNGAGGYADLVSDAVALDLTPPAAARVFDGATRDDGDVALTAVVGSVSAHWPAFSEPDSALDHYEWCVGTSPGKGNVVACHSV